MRIADKAMLQPWSWAEFAWQDSSDTVGEFNGTVPTADSASIPVYRGGVFLILQRRMM